MMSDLIDNAAGELQQAGSQLARGGVRTGVKIAAGTTRISVRVLGSTAHGVLALLGSVRRMTRTRAQEGELNLRQFTRMADGKREVVPIKDAEVARQLSRELRRHAVTFAIERNADGSRTFHVQGKDATLIEHALTVASVRVDERIARSRERAGVDQGPQDASLTQEPGTRVIELTDPQKATLAEALRESAPGHSTVDVATLADQVERDGKVTLTEDHVHAIDSALTGSSAVPDHLSDVAAAVDEEKAAIVADTPAATDAVLTQDIPTELTQAETPDTPVTLALSGKERDALVSQMHGTMEKERGMVAATVDQQLEFSYLPQLAERIETTSQVELTPLNVQQLRKVFADHDWTPGTEGDRTPEHMRWVVSAVNEEHDRVKVHTVDVPQQAAEAIAPAAAQPDTTPRLVEHGRAPYQHQDGETQSYFAVVDRGGVQQTIWGVDLERAIEASGAQIGDKISVENIGSIPVTLPDGTQTHRNTWNVTVADGQRQTDATLAQAKAPKVTSDRPVPRAAEAEVAVVQGQSAHEVQGNGDDQVASAVQLAHDAGDRGGERSRAAIPGSSLVGIDEAELEAAAQARAEAQSPVMSQSTGERANPCLRDDLPVQEIAAIAEENDVVEKVRGERADGSTLSPDTSKAVPERSAQRPGQQRPRGGSATKDRNARDATRERVAQRIDTKVSDLKRQNSTDAGSRAATRVQGDEPRLPISRR